MLKTDLLNKKVLSWAFYDWANSAFALSVLAVLYPLFLGSFWSAGDPGEVVTQRLALVTAISSAIVCVISPVLGTIADAGGYRKRFLLILALLGAGATAALALPGKGEWQLALLLYLLASIGYYGSGVFYDSLIIDVTQPRYYSLVSTLGFALGYLGGALLLALHVAWLLAPEKFGFDSTDTVFRVAFASVGAWWLVFMLPLQLFVPEKKTAKLVTHGVVRAAYRELMSTMRHVRRYRDVVVFLIAYLVYLSGVFTVISMAANYGARLGFSQQDLVTAFMITNLAGFPATLLYGWAGHRFGPKRGIWFALLVYAAVSAWAMYMTEARQFYIMAVIIGCVQGGVQG